MELDTKLSFNHNPVLDNPNIVNSLPSSPPMEVQADNANENSSSVQQQNEASIHEKYEKFLSDLRENFLKRKFRKCLEDIKNRENLYKECKNQWKTSDIKIKCMLKIIQKKFLKYTGGKIKGIENWLSRVDMEIDKWFEELVRNEIITLSESQRGMTHLEEEVIEQLEICITHTLEQCYNYALYSRNEKHIADTAGYLALGERLIRYSSDFASHPDTFQITEKILLFTSSLLIADCDFESAKIYLSTTLKLAFKELQLRVVNEDQMLFEQTSFSMSSFPKNEQLELEKIFLNIIIAFFQIGVCQENLGDMGKAVEAYKQSKWFCVNFIWYSIPILSQFIVDVEKRAMSYHQLIETVKKNQNICKEEQKSKKELKPHVYYDEEMNLKKLDKIKNFVETMKIPDFDDDEAELFYGKNIKKSKYTKNILSTVNVLNNLMSSKFQNLINTLDKIEINKLDKETKSKIQKRIKQIKRDPTNEGSIDDNEPAERYNNNFPTDINAEMNIKQKKKIQNLTTEPTASTLEMKTRMSSTSKNRTSNYSHTITSSPKIKKQGITLYKSKKSDVEYFPYSDYLFKKSFRKKIEFLEKASKKEYKFQKQLLSSKKFEKIVVDPHNSEKVKLDCEQYFNKLLRSKMKVLKEEQNPKKKKEVLEVTNTKLERLKEKYEMKTIKSLNIKTLDELAQLKKTMDTNRQVTLRKEFIVEDEKHLKFPDSQKISELNKKLEGRIQLELQSLTLKEKVCSSYLHTDLKKKQPNFCPQKTMEDFISH